MVIDTHIHVFPDMLCPKVVDHMAKESPISPHTDGSIHQVIKNMNECGVDYGIMMPIVTNPNSQKNVNDYACFVQHHYSQFFALGSVHPDASDWKEELKRIKQMGLYGIKLHPDDQGFFMDDKQVYPLYEKIQELELPILFHTGYDPASPHVIHATPSMIISVARDFPDLTVIAAHTGAYAFFDLPLDYYEKIDNLYFDTAIAPYTISPQFYRRIINQYGASRFLFGTDSPWSDGGCDKMYFDKVGITRNERKKIMFQNAINIYNLPLNLTQKDSEHE
ncbi:MAG: amidohydrolase family protein [Eubacteriaceae bacterium]|nr:amidohydrolase family protein [Eubacteriaceae bacterium]